MDSKGPSRGIPTHFGALSRRGLNPDHPDGHLSRIANWLGCRAYCTQNSAFSSLAVSITVASSLIYCKYQRRPGWVASVAGYAARCSTCPSIVIHPTTSWPQCRARSTRYHHASHRPPNNNHHARPGSRM